MSVIDGGITYGCSDDLEDRAYGIAFAARDLERVLRGGGSLPKEYTIAGQVYRVVRITGVVADGKTNNQTALAAAVSASRGSKPTLLVLPPASNYYRYSDLLDLSENTYLVGYGAKVKPMGLRNTSWRLYSNSGVFGIAMDGLDGHYSRWLERHETTSPAFNAEGSKNGSVADAGSNGDAEAWIRTYGQSNVIMMDVHCRGSFSGPLRCTSNNVLVEGCSGFRHHSDGFHVVKGAANVTVRRCRILEGGDDGFSMIQYNTSPGAARPSNILIEECEVVGSRTRGFTTSSGKDILFLRCASTRTGLAPYMAATTSAHSLSHCEGIKFVECEAWRGSKVRGPAGSSNGAGFAIWSAGTHSWGVFGTEIRNCKVRWFTSGNSPDQFSGGIRTNAAAGPVETPIQSGNDFAAIVASE